jgi:uncharacterized phiE125 gp8 family phage protein
MVNYNSVVDIEFVETTVIEPVGLTEAKNFCKIDIGTDDDIIESMITSAREMCEDFTNIGFVEHNAVAVLNNSNGGITLPYGPLISINQVTNKRGDVLILDKDYTLSGNAFVRLLTPTEDDITIDYQTGYQVLPNRLKLAVLNTIYYLYDNEKE